MALIIAAEDVELALGISVTDADVQTAQDIVELFAGLDLATEVPEDRFTAEDLRRLTLAVQWQVAYLIAHPEILTRENFKRASANGASIEREDDGLLSPLTIRYIRQLSTSSVGGISIVTLKPTLPEYVEQPDLWVRV